MTTISNVARLVNGVLRNIDLAASGNALQVDSLQVGNTSPAVLTKTILNNLLALQNGTDFATGTNSHTHDGRYYTETELGSTTDGSSGAGLIGIDEPFVNFTPTSSNVQGALEGIDTALGTFTTDFGDDVFRVHDDGDPTKKIALEASGIATGTTRTVTMPDANVDLGQVNTSVQQDGSRPFTANQDFGGFNATGLADPTAAQHAATKAYVDAVALGLAPKKAVRVATTAPGTLATSFENGDTVDGITLATGDRILIKDQAAPEENGIYVVAASGAPTRATDFDSLSPIDEINGAWVPVQFGTANAGKIFVQYGLVATIDTDPITFEFYNPIASLIGGDMITVSGSTIAVDLASVSGLESSNPGNSAGQLRVKLEASNPTLQITGSNELGVKLDPAGAITTGASGILAAVDGSTLERNANALRVKASGITANELATNAVTTAKIADANVTAVKLAADVAGTGLVSTAGVLDVRGVYAPLTNGNAGTLAAGTLVYLTSTASTFDAADSDAEATCDSTVGVLFASTLTTATGKVQLAGRAAVLKEGGGSLTVGSRVYAAGTAGQVTQTAPTASGSVVFLVGIAVSTTEVLLQPMLVAVND